MAAGEAGDDAGEDNQGDAVADAALRNLLAKPHHEQGAGHQGGGGHKVEPEAGGERQALIGQGHRQGEPLHKGDEQGAVAGVLGDLAPPRLAFLAQLLQAGVHHAHQIHDDAGGDVGHDIQGQDAHPLQGAAGEHVEQFENAALILLEQRPQPVGVDARQGYVGADAVNQQGAEHEQQTVAQLREPRLRTAELRLISGHLPCCPWFPDWRRYSP